METLFVVFPINANLWSLLLLFFMHGLLFFLK